VLRTWLRSPAVIAQVDGVSATKLESLMSFIKKEVEGEQQIHLAKNAFQDTKIKNVSQNHPKKGKGDEFHTPITAAALFTAEKVQKCVFCAKPGHQSHVCFKGKKMTLEERNLKVKEAKVCFKCLKSGHLFRQCKSTVKCASCNKSHYELMCPGQSKSEEVEQVKEKPEVKTISAVAQSSVLTMKVGPQEPNRILRGTIQVRVIGPNRRHRTVRVLIDTGSDVSYIQKSLAKDLQLQPIGRRIFQTEVFGGRSEVSERDKYLVKIQGINGGEEELQMFSEEQICGNCDSIPGGPWLKKLSELKVCLTDVHTKPSDIEILMGCNHIGKLLTGNMIKLSPSVTATETSLGWYVTGEIAVQHHTYAAKNISLLTKTQEISALWDLDSLRIQDTGFKSSADEHDKEVKESFQKNLRRAENGRYIVQLPWISKGISLPTNRFGAEKRLQAVTKKLTEKGQFKLYDDIFRSWESEGIIAVCADDQHRYEGYFLPHRPVFKAQSLTTPVRPVFDASFRVGNAPSLNQCLEKGPNLQEVLLANHLRFRKGKVGGISDIRKAFQMMEVAKEDRKFQKFLWWESENANVLKVYQHNRVIFGMNCSPFILAAVLEYHLSNVTENEKMTSMKLWNSIYVDNSVSSFDSVGEYEKFKYESTLILSRAQMNLTQWESNSDKNMDRTVTSVLGYKWDKKQMNCIVKCF